jgi:predicted NAD/FAD-dependent oxidoreductase
MATEKGHHMKIRLLVARSGAGFSQARGEEIDVSQAEAMRMIAAGQAEEVGADPRAAKVERAVARPARVEKAAK